MIDKTNKIESEAYLPFMIDVTQYAFENDQKPFILVHEGADDLKLAKKIRAAVSEDIPIINEADPLRIKGILGACSATVGSRFHGIVSALSQGTPTLATGWSHKYEMLFDDYEFQEGLISSNSSVEEIKDKMDLLINSERRIEILKLLNKNSERLKVETENTWLKIQNCLRE
jgi:colanic acid/amylovoran biosynthesis protein